MPAIRITALALFLSLGALLPAAPGLALEGCAPIPEAELAAQGHQWLLGTCTRYATRMTSLQLMGDAPGEPSPLEMAQACKDRILEIVAELHRRYPELDRDRLAIACLDQRAVVERAEISRRIEASLREEGE